MKTLGKAGIKTFYKLYLDKSTIDEGQDQRYVYDFFAADDDSTDITSQNSKESENKKRSRKLSKQSKIMPPIRTSLKSTDSKPSDPGDPFDEESVKQTSVVLSLNDYLNFEADHFDEIKDHGKPDFTFVRPFS